MTNLLFITTFLKGYTTNAALIIGIGIQNIFILKNGITRSYLFTIAATCSMIESIMIIVAIYGTRAISEYNYNIITALKYGGIIFLLLYACKSFYNAIFIDTKYYSYNNQKIDSYKKTITNLLIINFFNPQMYLDNILILGGISGQFNNQEKLFFATGAIFAALMWFFSLAYGARYLSHFFKEKKSWRILNTTSGIIMCFIAISLLLKELNLH